MESCKFAVRVIPRSARTEVSGWEGDVLRVRVTAPPAGGRANAALIELLARQLDVPRSSVRIVRGLAARQKLIEVRGMTVEDARRRLKT
jgi:uncharacterized protein (TIGR00251 family)